MPPLTPRPQSTVSISIRAYCRPAPPWRLTIRRTLSYGRDPYYTPYVNAAADSTAAIDSVYFYPGVLPAGSAVASYYPADAFNGRVAIDGATTNFADPAYSLADQFNNGMRYYDELALFNARVKAGLESQDAPTFRLLLDDMY